MRAYFLLLIFALIYINKLSQNTILCSKLKVGYNLHKHLLYKNYWKYCIDFYFDIEDMHTTDLYLILFSYLRNQKIYCLNVFSLATSKKNYKIFSKKTGFELNKMTYREFETWWEYRQWYDSALIDKKEEYGFRIEFEKNLVDFYIKENNLSIEMFYLSYKPSYPWSMDIINIFSNYLDLSNEDVFWEKTRMYNSYKKPRKY